MNKPQDEEKDLVWDRYVDGYIERRDYRKEWRENGCVRCPCCEEVLAREDDEQLVYCDNCGYNF